MKMIKNKQLHKPTMRVIEILETLSSSTSGLGLSELSQKTGFPKSTIAPIINALVFKKYIDKDESTIKYTLGIKSYLTGLSYFSDYNNSNNLDVIRREMKDIVNICNETCQLGILIDDEVFYLVRIDSEQPVNLLSKPGEKIPAYATALGKALLSGYSNETIKENYKNGLKPFTENTITDINVLLNQIENIRDGELAYEYEEITKDIGCFSIPLKKDKKVIAAISISMPLFRVTDEKTSLIKETLHKKARIIEKIINELEIEFSINI